MKSSYNEMLRDSAGKLIGENSSLFINLDQNFIWTTEDKVRLCLQSHISKLERKKEWRTPFSIFITILIMFLTTQFQDFIFNSDVWTAFFLLCGILSLGWLIYSIKFIFINSDIDQIIEKIKSQELNEYELARFKMSGIGLEKEYIEKIEIERKQSNLLKAEESFESQRKKYFKLYFENGDSFEDLDFTIIESKLRSRLDAVDKFVVLSTTDLTYIQTILNDEGDGYILEYQIESLTNHYKCTDESLTIDEVINAFKLFFTGNTELLKNNFNWEKIKIKVWENE